MFRSSSQHIDITVVNLSAKFLRDNEQFSIAFKHMTREPYTFLGIDDSTDMKRVGKVDN